MATCPRVCASSMVCTPRHRTGGTSAVGIYFRGDSKAYSSTRTATCWSWRAMSFLILCARGWPKTQGRTHGAAIARRQGRRWCSIGSQRMACWRNLGSGAAQRSEARRRYSRFVREGLGKENIWADLRQQIYLGDEKFVARMQKKAKVQGDELSIPRAQRRTPGTVVCSDRSKASRP